MLLPHHRHRGRGCSPLTLPEGGGWSLPLISHDGQRRDFSGGLGLEGAEEKQAQGGSEIDSVALKMHLSLEAPD